MKKTAFKISSLIASLIPINVLIKLSGINVIYPFYHIVSDHPPDHIKHLYKVRSVNQFNKDLDFLLNHFKPIKIIPIDPLFNNDPGFCLSFDDGLKECIDTIIPILKEKEIKAVFFINSDFADNKDLFFKYKASIIAEKLNTCNFSDEVLKKAYDIIKQDNKLSIKKLIAYILQIKFHDKELLNELANILEINFGNYLKYKKPYMSSEEIKELATNHIIGAHSIDHPLYSELNLESQIDQTVRSIEYLSDKFGTDKKLFAFPFTDNQVSSKFFEEIFKNKHADYTFGTAGIKRDIITENIQRIPIEMYGRSAEKCIKTEYLMYIIKRIFRKHKIRRR